jgi:Putative transposase of IS4/5 family (DUF4096)
MHVLKVGCRWIDCPKEYGPSKTIYNRFARWSEPGIRQKIFETVAAPSEPPEQVVLDSSHVKAHRCASGGKGVRISGNRAHERRPQQQNPCDRRHVGGVARRQPDPRPSAWPRKQIRSSPPR